MKAHPAAELFPMLPEDDLEALASDIGRNGLLEPIVVLDGRILDGRNRFAACKLAGVEPTFTAYTGSDPIAFVLSLNLHRRHLNESQRGMLGADAMALWAKNKVADLPQSKGTSRERAAGIVNVSARTVQGAKKILQAGAAEIVAAVRAGDVAIDDAVHVVSQPKNEQITLLNLVRANGAKTLKDALKRATKAEIVASIKAEPAPLPGGRYRVIVADPPWRYDSDAAREHDPTHDPTHRATPKYPTMSIEEICALPVPLLAEDDCILWLWTTNAFMCEAYLCLDAWGFKAKTILTWAKNKMGMGVWLRGQSEHCILAVRGKPTVTLTNQTTVLQAKSREHSRKPDEFYSLVDALCPGSKVELFAREARPGWTAWGAEKAKFDGAA